MSEPVLPGYDDLVLLGFGDAGEVWRARHRRSGDLVAVRRLVGADPDAVAQVRAAATVVRSLPGQHVVRVRTFLRQGDEDLLVLDHADGGALPVHSPLTAGQVVTVVAPLAEALAQAHARGLVHGHLGTGSVLLATDGRPLLDGLGLAALRAADQGHDPTGALGPAADVWALGALVRRLLTGQAEGELPPTTPLPLVTAVEAAQAFDPADRPTAQALADLLLAACPALPLQASCAVPSVTSRPGRLPERALVLRAAAVLLVLLGVAAAGISWGRHAANGPGGVPLAAAPSPPAAVVRPTPVPRPGWTEVLLDLDTRRAEAFARADLSLLAQVYVAGSAVDAADRSVLGALAERGARVTGLRHEVDVVTPLRSTTDRVELEVTESLAAYVLVERTGPVRHAATPPVTHVVSLERTAAGWRIAAVH